MSTSPDAGILYALGIAWKDLRDDSDLSVGVGFLDLDCRCESDNSGAEDVDGVGHMEKLRAVVESDQ